MPTLGIVAANTTAASIISIDHLRCVMELLPESCELLGKLLVADSRDNSSLNNVFGPQEQRLWDRHPQRLCGLQVDGQLELRRLLDWQLSGLCPFENLVDVGRGTPVEILQCRP